MTTSQVTIRPGTSDDAAACGQLLNETFGHLADSHGFEREFGSAQVAASWVAEILDHPSFCSWMAESGGRLVGCNFLDERTEFSGLGPVAISPASQNRGLGARLMEAAHTRARERGASGIRLVQDGYNVVSLALYAKMGFVVREPLVVMSGSPLGGATARPAADVDIDACAALCKEVLGYDRSVEIREAASSGIARVVERQGRLAGYTTGLGYEGHTVARSWTDVQDLIAGSDAIGSPGFLVSTRNSEMLAWCLSHGFRIRHPVNLMTFGAYAEPNGVFLPTVLG